ALVARAPSASRPAEATALGAAMSAIPTPATVAPASTVASAPHPPTVPDSVMLHVVSNAPGAQAMLRGKSVALPYHADVPRGSVPEIVRVSAPHCQGRQYWITFDQARYLAVELRPGSGLVEATAAETAVALGEAAPTERMQPAAWHAAALTPAARPTPAISGAPAAAAALAMP